MSQNASSAASPASSPYPSSSSSFFSGLHIQDKRGRKLADVRAEVSRKGVRLEGKRGVLGNFPFQSILSWTHSRDNALGLIVMANGGQREIVLHSAEPGVVPRVLEAIDLTVNAIVEEMKSAEEAKTQTTASGAGRSEEGGDSDATEDVEVEEEKATYVEPRSLSAGGESTTSSAEDEDNTREGGGGGGGGGLSLIHI